MAEERLDMQFAMARLNEVADLVAAIKAGALGGILKPGGGLNKCDYDCGCNHSMCGCRGTVSKMDELSVREFMNLRETRVADLKRQLEALEMK